MPQREHGTESLLQRLWQAHREAITGVLEFEVRGRSRRILLEAGEIYLSPDSPWAAQARELGASGSEAGWDGLLGKLLESYFNSGTAQALELRVGERVAGDAVGPVPTEALVRRAFAASAPVPPADQPLVADPPPAHRSESPACYSPEEVWILERLRRPMPLDALARECPFDRARLEWALAGLVAIDRVHRPQSAPAMPQDSGLLKLVELLSERIGESLREKPLGLLDDALQRRLTSVGARADSMTHYELLGVAADADDESIQKAFESFARQVHPSHAERPGVGISHLVLTRLFERSVAALRTLGDPALRAEYDSSHGVAKPAPKRSSGDRRDEVVELARREFDRARFEEINGDLHTAMILYEQVVQLDQRAEYYLALARLQAKNTAWTSRALETCKRALDLDTENVDARFLVAVLYEHSGQVERAAAHYHAAAHGLPPHAEAAAALRRLAARGVKMDAARAGGALGRLFRRS